MSSTSTILAVVAAGNFAGLVVPSSQSEAERFAGWFGMQERRSGAEDNAQIAVTTSLMFEAGSDC
jgi:hypothetical protein